MKILLILVFVFSIFSHAEEIKLEGAENLEYYKENGKQVIRGTGRVTLKRKDSELSADEIIAYVETKDVFANGNVIFKEKDSVLSADKFIYNLDNKNGILKNAQIFTSSAYITGRVVRKLGEDLYEAEDASYTTCLDCIRNNEPPHWQIRSRKLKAEKEGYATTEHTSFNVLDMPVFYFPWFIFPIKTKRQTGFLPPNLMSSVQGSKAQMGLGTQFFWAISRSYDATHYYNYISDHGHKNGLEFRYVPSESTTGEVKGFFIKDKSADYELYAKTHFIRNSNRWGLSLQHSTDFNPQLRFRAKGAYISDQLFLQDFPGDVPAAEQSVLKSSAILVYNTENTLSTIDNSYYYHMSALNQKDVTHKLPEVNFFSITSPVFEGIPINYSLDVLYTFFAKRRDRFLADESEKGLGLPEDVGNDGIQHTDDNDGSEGNGLIDSGETKRGHRMILKPELYVPFTVFKHFKAKPVLTNSTLIYKPQVQAETTEEVPYKNVWDFTFDVSTDFSKNFSVKKIRYKHLMQPEIRYLNRFWEYKKGAHPYFDSFDETGKIQKLALRLNNLFISEEKQKEVFQLFLEQRFNIEYLVRKYSAKSEKEEEEAKEKAQIDQVLDPFKVVAKMDLGSPIKFINTITGRSELYYDYYEKDVNRISSQIELKDYRTDKITLKYTKDTRKPIKEVEVGTAIEEASSQTDKDDIHYLQTYISIYLNQNFTVSYQNDFSIVEGKRHQDIVGADFTPNSKCWNLSMRFQSIKDGKEEKSFSTKFFINWGIMQL